MARIPSSLLSYDVDWSSLDDEIDAGRFVRWVDDPAWRWYGSPYEDLMLDGQAECPVCFEALVDPDGSLRWVSLRRPRQTCPYCLRSGREERIPSPTPPKHVSRAAEIKFKARIKAARKKEPAVA